MFGKRRDREEIRRALDELAEHARSYTLEDLTSGRWLAKYIKHALADYAAKTSAKTFERRYPGTAFDSIARRRIERTKRLAAVASGLTATAHSAAVAALLGSGGSATAIALPATATAFVADLLFTTRLQLLLAFDLSVLYGHRVNLDDPDELMELLQVAFGITPKPEELGEQKSASTQARKMAETVYQGTRAATSQTLSYVGKRLVRRTLVKLTAPIASIPLSFGMSYLSAGKTAKAAQKVFKQRARASQVAIRIAKSPGSESGLLLEALWVVVGADKKLTHEESHMIEHLAEQLGEPGAEAATRIKNLSHVTESAVLAKLQKAPRSVRNRVFDALEEAAAVDERIGLRERAVLSRLAEACGR